MLPILTYHSLDSTGSVVSTAPEEFAAQMNYLVEAGFTGISLRTAIHHFAVHGMWPAKSVVLTFDDGFENFCSAALPVLLRHEFTATLFIVSGYMGKYNDWSPPPPGLGRQKIVSWRQAAAVAAAGMEIGSHTQMHPDLRRCSPAEREREISGSRAEIEDHLNAAVQSFAFPYGWVSREALRLTRQEYLASCTTVLRRANGDSLDLLPRVDTYYLKSRHNFERLLHGRLDLYLSLRRWGRRLRRLSLSD